MNTLLKFYTNINKIKHIERKGWKKLKKGTKDTIASHSFGSSMIAWLLAKKENVDENKLIKMLLVHDLIMGYVKDYTPTEKEYVNKKKIENNNLKRMLKDIPIEIRKEIKELFEEFQEEKTKEAILAKECDKLDTILQSTYYSNSKTVSNFLNSYKHYFKNKHSLKIFKQLNNRFVKKMDLL